MVDSANKAAEMANKSSGIVVDMSPAAMLHHVTLRDSREEELPTNASTTSISTDLPTNLINTPPTTTTTFRCERCDNFETSSRATLLLHVVQCLSPSPVVLRHPKQEDEPTNSNNNNNSTVSSLLSAGGSSNDEPSAGHNNSIVANMVAAAGNGGSASSSAASSTSSNSSRKVFECDVCNMKFSNGANMRRHKMRHTGVKPYECRVCQKRFFRKDHLAEHFTTHTKTLPYHCPICNRGFQRQIAMRAHFQNEHVGQHDLVKTCPLCSYRAGSMKSLRIHFFNRHGIDLDNPTTGGTSSLLLALESQASQVVAAAAAASYGLNAAAAAAAAAAAGGTTLKQQDKLDNYRGAENATPPIHFLTPHVEISTLSDSKAEFYNDNGVLNCQKLTSNKEAHDNAIESTNAATAAELSIECHAKSLPSSIISSSSSGNSVVAGSAHLVVTASAVPAATTATAVETSSKSHYHDNHITPSISLIPIKQEPFAEDMQAAHIDDGLKSQSSKSSDEYNTDENADKDALTNSRSLTSSLIKVSPLKSLLREDLKRRICAKANNRLTRNSVANFENNNVIMQQQQQQQQQQLNNATRDNNNSNNSMSGNCTLICNGTITSTGQETDNNATLLNRKQILICIFCGIEFPDETLYFLHKGCHCESNPWKCNICGEQCNNIYEFNSHLLSKSHQ